VRTGSAENYGRVIAGASIEGNNIQISRKKDKRKYGNLKKAVFKMSDKNRYKSKTVAPPL
jgi:hypothetical protein